MDDRSGDFIFGFGTGCFVVGSLIIWAFSLDENECKKKWDVNKCVLIYVPESAARRIENLQPGADQ